MRSALLAILIDAAPPLAVFFVLQALGVSDVIAYTAGGIVPLVRLVIDRIRHRPFNAISAMVLVLLVVSVVLALVTHDARAVIARGGVIYLAIALVAVVSLFTRRPAMLVLSRYMAARAHPESVDRFDRVFAEPRARRAMRMVTAGWAVGFVVSAVVCVVCAYSMPISAAAVVTSLVEPVTALLLAGATAPFLRRALASLRTGPAAA
jgi:hypothetical protein